MAERKGRVPEVSLENDVARRIMEMNTPMAATAEKLWRYQPLCFKPRLKWDKICPHRSIVQELFIASGGFLLRQKCFDSQIDAFMTGHKMEHTWQQAVSAAYSLRVMMSGLRDCKVGGRRPPNKYQQLQCILDLINVSAPEVEGEEPGGDAVVVE